MEVFELWDSLVNHGKNSPLQTIICDEDVRNVLEEEKEEARAIGLAEGRATGLVEGREAGRAEGRAEGLLEGEKLKVIETAKKMLAENCDINFITKITDLSKEQILDLQ